MPAVYLFVNGCTDVDLAAIVASFEGSFAPVFSGGGGATVNGLSSSFLVSRFGLFMAIAAVLVILADRSTTIALRCRIAPAASSCDSLIVARARWARASR
jgi:hypothetical protein